MTNKYKKEIEEINRRVYGNKKLAELKRIGKKRGLLNVDQYKKTDKNILIERLVKGKQIKDEDKDVLLEQARNNNIKVNSNMSKEVIFTKDNKPKTHRLKECTIAKISGRERYTFSVSNDR